MQRLARRLTRTPRPGAARLGRLGGRRDRGAVSVVAALLSVVLVGFAAVSVDLSAVWADRQQLQTGADAAALAVAQSCAKGACGSPGTTATSLAQANKADGHVTAQITELTANKVTVRTSTVRNHWFAPVIGVNSTPIEATATVRWGAVSGGAIPLPLAFSWCAFKEQTGGGVQYSTTEYVVELPKKAGIACNGPSGNPVPGGFGWLKADPGKCQATNVAGGIALSEPGNNPSQICTPSDFDELVGDVILVPIYDIAGGTGNNAFYKVYGYAAFKLTGYYFAGQFSNNAPCSGSSRCVKGYFVKWVDLGGDVTYSSTAPNLGASVVDLTD